jgi:hypothetical protein
MIRTFVAAFVILVVGSVAALAEPAGNIKSVSGEAWIDRGGQQVPAEIGAPVEAGDLMVTGEDGAMGVTFRDNTMISLGPNSEVTVDDFVYDPKNDKLSFASRIARGTMQQVSGNIAKLDPDAVSVRTPNASLAVRGTRFVIRVPQPEKDDEDRQ